MHFSRLLLSALVLTLAGCSGIQTTAPTPLASSADTFHGALHGGQQPVSGATIQLYTVNTSTDSGASTPLLTNTIKTDASGNFSFSSYTACPSSSSLMYITATGGNPGLAANTNNTGIAGMAVIGTCSSLGSFSFLNINEVTTVAAVSALRPYMLSPSAVGADTYSIDNLTADFTLATQLADLNTGTAPGKNVPSGYTVPVPVVNAVADIIASCINSAGGTAGDGSPCGTLYTLTTPSGSSTAPTNTVNALLNLANNPALNNASLFNLISASSPFQPIPSQLPADLGIRLQANAPDNSFTASPTSLNFGSGPIGIPLTQTVTFSNNSRGSNSFGSVALAGVNPGDFSFSNSTTKLQQDMCSYDVGQTCAYIVTFTPQASGTRTAYLNQYDSQHQLILSVPLSGTGSGPADGPVTLTGATSVPPGTSNSITLTNSGNTALAISSISINNDGSGTENFTQTNNCGTSLYSQSICTIRITGDSGSLSGATVTVNDSALPGYQTATVNSTGAVYTFPARSVGTSSPSAIVASYIASSQGTASITGTNATDFILGPTNCSYFHADQYCTVSAVFKPTNTGLRTATLNAGTQGYSYVLSGSGLPAGAHFTISPNNTSGGIPNSAGVDLSYQLVNAATTTTVTINNVGTTTLNIPAPTITGRDASVFSTSNCSSSSCTFSAISSTVGFKTATATFTDTTSGVSQSIALFFRAYPTSSITPSSLAFPLTPVNTASSPQTITINAYYAGPVSVSTVSGPFSVTPNGCSQVPCTFTVTFTPPAVNTYYGSISFTDQQQSINSVSLSGSGGSPAGVQLSPTAITYSSRPVGSTSIPTSVTLQNSGTFPLNLSSISLTGANPSDYMLTNNCGTTVAANGNCTFSISFSPTASGTRTATVSIVSNAATSPDSVSLTGTAQ